MNINKTIITVSVALAVLSSAVPVSRAVMNRNDISGQHLNDIEKKVEDYKYVNNVINTLSEKANQQATYDWYISYCSGVGDLNESITAQRKLVVEDAAAILEKMGICNAKIDELRNKKDGNARIYAEMLENDVCFNELQSALWKCDADKRELDNMINEYKKEQAAKVTPKPANKKTKNKSDSNSTTKKKSPSGGNSSKSSGSSSSSESSRSSSSTGSSGSSSSSDSSSSSSSSDSSGFLDFLKSSSLSDSSSSDSSNAVLKNLDDE